MAVATAVVLGVMGGSALADDLDPKEIYERAAPATVHVLGSDSAGTGVVYDAGQGLIVTNAHVVQGQAALKAAVGDHPPAPVQVLGVDPCEDLAVLKFSAPQDGLKELKFGSSKDVETADSVTALGYPESYGDQSSAKAAFTTGSVQNSDVKNAEPSPSLPRYPDTIQHSATLNPGNSGGPLLNGKGEVVGINTLRATGEVSGQFYAISSDHVRPLLDSLAAGDTKNDPGWNIAALSDPGLSEEFVPEDQAGVARDQKKLINSGVDGVVVLNVRTNSPAYKAHLGGGDLITDVKDTPVTSVGDVCDILQSAAPGEKLALEGVWSFNVAGTKYKFGEAWAENLTLSPAKP
ncbi:MULTISPECIES: S1C family serine protease [unclassified Streptomyces]|uniref:S1C family serine protease n=1 Tax=unclassified Streptomyces TaxID=2593676 RepID=UPI0027E4792F|nr:MULTISPECIES: S1C family serine protease [unclassified Streptomyces]